jgi:RNase P subunit RPR2
MKPVETPVCCKRCGMPFGIKLYDRTIIINGLIISQISGACMECGTVFHYSVKDDLMEVIVKRAIDRKQAHDNAK